MSAGLATQQVVCPKNYLRVCEPKPVERSVLAAVCRVRDVSVLRALLITKGNVVM